MKLAVSLSADFGTAAADAQWADEAGLAAIAIPDHLLRAHAVDPGLAAGAPAPEPFVQLAAIARETRDLRLVVLSSPITFRHPAILLKTAIELSIVSDGRFTLGLGTGYRREEHDLFGVPFPSLEARYARLESALGYLRAGLAEPNPGFRADDLALAAHPVSPAPRGVRLLVGGSGRYRTPALAGTYADEFNGFAGTPDDLRDRIRVARDAHRRAGRDDRLAVSVAGPLITGRTTREVDDAAARQAAVVGSSGSDYFDRHAASPSSFVGTHADVAERLAEIAALGVDRCYFVFEGALDREGVLGIREALAGHGVTRPDRTTSHP